MPRAKGERKLEILKALAEMLEAPKWEKITTAALAEKLGVSEAALYRHFASKAQMYEGLIEFIESSVFTLANRITQSESDGLRQAAKLVEMLLAFAEKNPGMVRVMTGDALTGEHERLQVRMNQFFERFESTLKQSLRVAGHDAHHAGILLGESEQHLDQLLGLLAAVGFVGGDLVGEGEDRLLDELDQALVHLRLGGEVAV